MTIVQRPRPVNSPEPGPPPGPSRTIEERALRGLLRTVLRVRGLFSSAQGDVPPYEVWRSGVAESAARTETYLRTWTPNAALRAPALILDIDNTALETHYHPSLWRIPATRPVLAIARLAAERGIAIIFVTGRPRILRRPTLWNLRHAGYPVDELYMRGDQSDLGEFKSGVRAQIEKRYTIIANIGNNRTDFDGCRAYRRLKLPDYDQALD